MDKEPDDVYQRYLAYQLDPDNPDRKNEHTVLSEEDFYAKLPGPRLSLTSCADVKQRKFFIYEKLHRRIANSLTNFFVPEMNRSILVNNALEVYLGILDEVAKNDPESEESCDRSKITKIVDRAIALSLIHI